MNSFFLQASPLQNYGGQTSPVMGIVFAILLAIMFLGPIVYYLWLFYYTVIRFKQLCKENGLTSTEIDLLNSYIHLFQIKDKTAILEKRSAFDDLSQQAGLTFTREDAREILKEDARALYLIRKKLRFRHGFNGSKILSSRSIPKGHSVTILHFDESAKRYTVFETQISERREFLFEIKGPILAISMQILHEENPPLEVRFKSNNGKMYRFDTLLQFATIPPENIWYLQHSRKIHEIESIKSIAIEATALYSSDKESSDVEDLQIIITYLDYRRLHFKTVKEALIKQNGFVVCNFLLGDKEVSCQGVINEVSIQEGSPEYIIYLKEQSEKNLQLFIAFMISPMKFLLHKKVEAE